jgi:two-component system, NtrC family, nitrogen regulation response regulator NtrX
VKHFAAQVCDVNGWKPKVFLPEAIQELQRYSWPGNVRELRNMVERLLLLADGAVDAALVRLALPAGDGEVQVMAPVQSGSLAERTDAFEREQILAELKRHHQRMTDTARALGLERSHLYKKCQALGIDLRAMRSGGA